MPELSQQTTETTEVDADIGAPRDRGKDTVLVAEESVTLRELLRFWLECFGYRVVTVEIDGQARGLLEQEGVDLVLSGNDAPGMNGLDLLETLRGTHCAHLPVVLLSEAIGDTAAAVVARRIRVDALLSKDRLDGVLLLDTIDGLLRACNGSDRHRGHVPTRDELLDHGGFD